MISGYLLHHHQSSRFTSATAKTTTAILLLSVALLRARVAHSFVLSVQKQPSFARSTFTSSSSLAMSSQDKKRVLVPIANGSEEIETTCITDTLVRFGAHVTIASVHDDTTCKMSRGINVVADTTMAKAAQEEWDLIVLPGGMPGAEHLRDCVALTALLQKQKQSGKLYAAICAAPAVALHANGLIDANTQTATCYPAPAFRSQLGSIVSDMDAAVVVSGNLITSQGPGTALLFALELGQQLYGKEKRKEIADQMLVK